MMSKVKCLICDEYFDKTQGIKIGNRYIHKDCFYNTDEGKKIQLEEYIKKVMHLDKITPLIKKQIMNYYSIDHYSYDTILFTLQYFYEIKHGDYKKAKGIGIVTYVYDEAKEYYNNLISYQQEIQNVKIKPIENKYIQIKMPQRKKKNKIDLLSILKEN